MPASVSFLSPTSSDHLNGVPQGRSCGSVALELARTPLSYLNPSPHSVVSTSCPSPLLPHGLHYGFLLALIFFPSLLMTFLNLHMLSNEGCHKPTINYLLNCLECLSEDEEKGKQTFVLARVMCNSHLSDSWEKRVHFSSSKSIPLIPLFWTMCLSCNIQQHTTFFSPLVL